MGRYSPAFQLDKSDMRGRVARLDGVLSGVLKQHAYPPVVRPLLRNDLDGIDRTNR